MSLIEPLSEEMLAEFETEAKTTRALLALLADENLNWRPHPRSMTLGRLASHLVELLEWGEAVLADAELNFAAGADAPRDFATARAILENYEARAQEIGRLLAAPRRTAWRTFIVNHLIHHRGQLTVYLRLLEIPLPPVYGPTADAAF